MKQKMFRLAAFKRDMPEEEEEGGWREKPCVQI
jgi:hypothetical protein